MSRHRAPIASLPMQVFHSLLLKMLERQAILFNHILPGLVVPFPRIPTAYPRPLSGSRLVEAARTASLSDHACLALLNLILYDYEDNNREEGDEEDVEAEGNKPSAFHLLLAMFNVSLPRYTTNTDLVMTSCFPISSNSLLLRVPIDATDRPQTHSRPSCAAFSMPSAPPKMTPCLSPCSSTHLIWNSRSSVYASLTAQMPPLPVVTIISYAARARYPT